MRMYRLDTFSLASFKFLWNPIGQHIYNQIRACRVVRFQMNCKIMWTIHTFMHHENAGFDNRTFTGLEYHRTDGQLRRSAPLQHLDVRFFLEA